MKHANTVKNLVPGKVALSKGKERKLCYDVKRKRVVMYQTEFAFKARVAEDDGGLEGTQQDYAEWGSQTQPTQQATQREDREGTRGRKRKAYHLEGAGAGGEGRVRVWDRIEEALKAAAGVGARVGERDPIARTDAHTDAHTGAHSSADADADGKGATTIMTQEGLGSDEESVRGGDEWGTGDGMMFTQA